MIIMEKLFLEFRKKYNSNEDFSHLDLLDGKTISIAGTVQYLDFINPIKDYLEKKGKTVLIKKGAFHNAHVIGCNPSAFDKKAQTLLLLADGKFHATNNALILNREIFVFNLFNLEKFSRGDLDILKKKIIAKQTKFLSSDIVGIIVSNKLGQNFRAPEKIAKSIEKLNKKVFIFETDNINLSELENFPKIQIWINTACFGLASDSLKIINIQDILQFL